MFFDVFIFEVCFVLKIEESLCLFALSWTEIEHKIRHCHGENSFVFIHEMYEEKLRKRDSELAGGKNE